jgi:uridine phosphorylase
MSLTELPITGLPVGGVSPRVIVCGDPARADRIAARLDDAAPLSHKREYRAHRGTYRGQPVTVCSHGVGAPGAAVAFEELIAAGAQIIVRVGTCGGMQPNIHAGHLIIAAAAVDNTGYGRETVPAGYPAAADPALTLALETAAGPAARTGIVLSRDNFYAGVPVAGAPDYRSLSQARVLAVEMECAALFLVGALRGARTAAILVVDGNVLEAAESMEGYQPGQPIVRHALDTAISCALEALCRPT